MKQHATADIEQVIPREARERGKSAIIGVAVMNMITQASLVAVSALFLLSLGATPLQIGLLTTFTQLGALWQLLGLQALPRIGKARFYILGRNTSLLPLLLLVLLAFSGKTGGTAVWIAIALLTLRVAITSLGETGWWPLVQDNTRGDAIGEYFARMRSRSRIAEVVMPLLIGWFLGATPVSTRFAPVFAIAVLAIGAGSFLLRQVREVPAERKESSIWQRLRGVMAVESVRRYGIYIGLRTAILALCTPFWVVFLTGRDLPASNIVWLSSLSALGNVCGLFWWARLVDRHGSRVVLTITLTTEALLGLVWLLMPHSVLPLLACAVFVYLLWGISEGGYLLGQTRAMMDAVPTEHQAEGFVLFTYLAAIGGALGGFLGGMGFQWVSHLPALPFGFDARALFLAGSHIALLVAWYASTRLCGYSQQTPVHTLLRKAMGRITVSPRG